MRKPGQAKTANKKMKNWLLGLSVSLNLVLVGVLVFLNDRYGLWAKVQRVALVEGRLPGLVSPHDLNRNYQVRREMFRLDRNESEKVLMLGDSLTAQGEWNAMLGEPLVANRGIDGDTSAGVLARLGDDADFRGDAVVIWIGTNDVLHGGAAGPVAERIMEAARGKAEILKRNLTTKDTNLHEIGKIIDGKIIGTTESTTEQRGRCETRKLGKAEGRATESWPQRGAASGTMQVNEQPKVGPKGTQVAREAARESAEGSPSGARRAGASESTLGAGATESKEEAGQRLAGQAGAAFSNPSTSELARDSENLSLTHFASGPAFSPATSYPLPATAPEAQVFVLGIPPMATWWEGARERNATIREINARLAQGAEQNGYRFIELESVLADENGFLNGDMTSDGVHLSAKGYVAVLEKMKDGPLSGWRVQKNSI